MIIRPEVKSDYGAVRTVVREAFLTAEHSDGNEVDLVEALRMSVDFIPELALVAEEGNKIIGHILFTRLRVGEMVGVALAPLAVLPCYQRQGVGKQLIERGHEIARQLGYSFSIVLGSDTYYPRFGYVPTDTYQIEPPFEVPKEFFMIYLLDPQKEIIPGPVIYAKEFGL